MSSLHNASVVLEIGREGWPQQGARQAKHRVWRPLYLSGVMALLLGDPTWAVPTASITAGTTNPAVNETFTVTLNLADASAFACWGAVARYDGAKLALVSQTNGSFSTFAADSRGTAAMNPSGEARTGGYALNNNGGGAGTLAVLTFRALAEGVTTISLDPKSPEEPFGLAMYSTNGTVAVPSAGASLQIVIGGGDPNLDSDADGIPDWWMTRHFGHPTGQAADLSRADDDPDGDRMSNWKEWYANTVPTNRLSVLCLTDCESRMADGGVVIRWQSGSNRWYTVQGATNFVTTGFNLNLRTNIPATPPENVHTDSVSGAKCKFYRVKVE